MCLADMGRSLTTAPMKWRIRSTRVQRLSCMTPCGLPVWHLSFCAMSRRCETTRKKPITTTLSTATVANWLAHGVPKKDIEEQKET